jgi:hypothetical protein
LASGYVKYKQHKEAILKSVIEWFAFEANDYLIHFGQGKIKDTQFSKLNLKNAKLFSFEHFVFSEEFLTGRGFEVLANDNLVFKRLVENYALELRGHTLFEVHNLLSSEISRKHKNSTEDIRYNESQLLNICFAYSMTNQTNHISRISERLNQAMA